DLAQARGDNVELTLAPAKTSTVIRLLGYENHARMGSYAEALARARATNAAPDIVADDRPGRAKYGWGVNVEQPLADSGETGALRYRPEAITEAYYRLQLNPFTQVSPDVQVIQNPGYNRDRGPATTVSLRLNLRY